jgi:uncharacterized protein YajQ (UPF0234 family)
MPSFDIVSEVDLHEVSNAVDQANREIGNRFDFKGTDSVIERNDAELTLRSQSEFQLQQMLDILHNRLTRRGVDIQALQEGEPSVHGNRATLAISIRQGIDQDTARALIRRIKDSRLKVQAAIQGDQIRVSGKNRNDLQKIISSLRQLSSDLPLQFSNFRD